MAQSPHRKHETKSSRAIPENGAVFENFGGEMKKKYNYVVELIDASENYPDGAIIFDDGSALFSHHDHDCCENHFLSLKDLSIDDFDKLKFDLSNDLFFNRIVGYGIELIPVRGHSVKIAGYGYNNGFYSEDLTLILDQNGVERKYSITECQLVRE